MIRRSTLANAVRVVLVDIVKTLLFAAACVAVCFDLFLFA